MSTVNFNSLIYTASKSLKKTDAKSSPEVHDDINGMLQDRMLGAVQYKAVFRQEMSIRNWFFQVMSKTFMPHHELQGKEDHENMTSRATCDTASGILCAISEMDQDLMIPFMMHFQGYNMEEISKELHLPIEVITNRIDTARLVLVQKIS